MNILYSKFNVSFETSHKDNKKVDVYYEFKVKRNLTYLFYINTNCLIRGINHFISHILNNYNKSALREGCDINRIIDDSKLEALNNTLNGAIHTWVPPKVKIKDLKIKYLI